MGRMISLIIPTRNRPKNIARFYESWVNTGSKGELILVTDHDDTNDYTNIDARVIVHRCNDSSSSDDRAGSTVEKINAGAEAATYDIIGFSGDDVVIRTNDWERLVSEVMTLEPLTLGFPMCGKGQKVFPTHVFMTRALYETLGWFAYPKLRHPWVDYAWDKVGRYLEETGKGSYRNIGNVLFEHLHPMYRSSVEYDETYQRAYAAIDGKSTYYQDYTPDF
tara:strand:+ start:11034 stop:11696 length:663 start_codon:yes stop_codon:yes gene_type:complete